MAVSCLGDMSTGLVQARIQKVSFGLADESPGISPQLRHLITAINAGPGIMMTQHKKIDLPSQNGAKPQLAPICKSHRPLEI